MSFNQICASLRNISSNQLLCHLPFEEWSTIREETTNYYVCLASQTMLGPFPNPLSCDTADLSWQGVAWGQDISHAYTHLHNPCTKQIGGQWHVIRVFVCFSLHIRQPNTSTLQRRLKHEELFNTGWQKLTAFWRGQKWPQNFRQTRIGNLCDKSVVSRHNCKFANFIH